MSGDLEDERWNVDFSVSKSMRYHAYRRAFWESFDYWTKILVLISGTAVIAAIIGDRHTWWSEIAAGAIAVLSITDIVLGFGGRARAHNDLYRSFCSLAKEIAENITPTELNISRWKARRLELEMNEPTALDWLEKRCSGEEARARGCELRASWKLPRWKIALSQWSLR